MLQRIALGTANFGMPYGILNQSDSCLNSEEVNSILNLAKNKQIDTFDTAYGYGASWEIVKSYFKVHNQNYPKIINKFSIKNDYETLFYSIKNDIEEIGISSLYALLIHDPQNIKDVNPNNLREFINKIVSAGLVQKVGVSVYSFEEVQEVNNIFPINIIQCPINPFNQKFLESPIQEFCKKNKIEVHARSLFLQGILLASELPGLLRPLVPYWQLYQAYIKKFNMSSLEVLLQWALSKNFVDKWILGISNEKDLQTILFSLKKIENPAEIINFDSLKEIYHPYMDPRNWLKK